MSRRTAGRSPRTGNVYAVTVTMGGRELPEFVPSAYADRPADGWTVETSQAAAGAYAEAHGLSNGAARAAWLAFANAYDLATGRATRCEGGTTRYKRGSLRRTELEMRMRAEDAPTPAPSERERYGF